MTNIKDYLKLYLVLETNMLKCSLEEFIPAVIKGGVTCIQLRDKFAEANERFATGQKLMELIGDDVLFVINDRADIAQALGCNTVHVGCKDVPLQYARKAFPQMTFGYSCNTIEDIKIAQQADYIGVGPAFMTDTKADLRGLIGPSGIAELLKNTDKPAVAIGGIGLSNIDQLAGTGVSGVAVSSAICAAEDPYNAALQLRKKVDEF
jgi:thiamine-phosphate pyrophosphorylase